MHCLYVDGDLLYPFYKKNINWNQTMYSKFSTSDEWTIPWLYFSIIQQGTFIWKNFMYFMEPIKNSRKYKIEKLSGSNQLKTDYIKLGLFSSHGKT